MDWNDGYRTDTVYTYGYYAEMNPCRIPFLFALAGVTPPEIATACELGYGQGLSLNIHAAAEPVAWYGTDFNPAQAAFAAELGAAGGADVHCFADSFRDFSGGGVDTRSLPEFDYIALHGIWSWISRENQAEIVRLIDRKLRVGGVLYISYNCYPGWAAMRPARDLMKLFMDSLAGSGGDILDKVGKSLEFMEHLMAVNPRFAIENPAVAKRLEIMRGQNRHYLAHEFFNRDWMPDSFADMAGILGEARLTYACSAQAANAMAGMGMSKEQGEFLGGIRDSVVRETAMDFIRNAQFRKDYWIKGARPLGRREQARILREQPFMLLRGDLSPEVQGSFGKATINQEVFDAIKSVMGDFRIHTLEEVELAAKGINLGGIAQAFCILMECGALCPAQKKAETARAKTSTDKLNAFIEARALDSGDIAWLASPVSGGGISVDRFGQLFILGMRRGQKTADGLAQFAQRVLSENSQHIVKDGRTLTDVQESQAELQTQAANFLEKRFPVLRALQVA